MRRTEEWNLDLATSFSTRSWLARRAAMVTGTPRWPASSPSSSDSASLSSSWRSSDEHCLPYLFPSHLDWSSTLSPGDNSLKWSLMITFVSQGDSDAFHRCALSKTDLHLACSPKSNWKEVLEEYKYLTFLSCRRFQAPAFLLGLVPFFWSPKQGGL